jgi:hypothetical protein
LWTVCREWGSRAYLNQGLIGPLVFWTVSFAVLGAVLAVAGGVSAGPDRPLKGSTKPSG